MSPPEILTGSRELIPPATTLFEHAFRDDPVFAYMLCNLAPSKKLQYLSIYFTSLLTAATMNSARINHPSDWTACSVIMPPNTRIDNPWTLIPAGILRMLWTLGLAGCRRMLTEFTPMSDAVKAKGLKGQKEYFYVFLVATDEKARGKGLASVLMGQCQEEARERGVPVWLEATTRYSMGLYEHLGFEVVEEFVLGKGRCDVNGKMEKGGVGVPIWGMVWWPEKK